MQFQMCTDKGAGTTTIPSVLKSMLLMVLEEYLRFQKHIAKERCWKSTCASYVFSMEQNVRWWMGCLKSTT